MKDTLNLSDPEQNVGQQVRRCYRRFMTLLNQVLGKYDFNPTCWFYLRVLWLQDGVSQKDLSDKAYVAENTTTAIVNFMLNEGLITRERDQHDRRKFNIFLSDKGHNLKGEALQYAEEINQIALEGIDVAELRTCLKVLIQVSENLEAAVAD